MFLSRGELDTLRPMLLADHLLFCRTFYRAREGESSKFIVSAHHIAIADMMNEIFDGKITRAIINMPPGYTKTEMVNISFVLHGLAINPRSKFIQISYSDALVQNNSRAIRDTIETPEYQYLWPTKFRRDTSGKRYWITAAKGCLYSASSGGQITGFRAGLMEDGFTGALIIDDPLKPADAYSAPLRERVLEGLTNTIKSRLAKEEVPIILIMQRLHQDDPTAALLKGATGEKWHHLILPALVPEQMPEPPQDWKYRIDYEPKIIFEKGKPLWSSKHSLKQLEELKDADPYTYSSQYDQQPTPLGGGVFKSEWWQFYEPKEDNGFYDYRIITGDTGMKTGEHNDPSVFQLWGYKGGKAYLLEQIRGKWEAPELRKVFITFWNACSASEKSANAPLRCAYIEDKSSGTGLIQDIKRDANIPIEAVPRHRDKVSRAHDIAPYVSGGFVYLPRGAEWLGEYMAEMSAFSETLSHLHDDQVDATIDAVSILLGTSRKVAGGWSSDEELYLH